MAPGTRWTVTLPGGAWVSYTHAVDPAEPWRAAGEVTGCPALVGAVLVTMAGSLEHLRSLPVYLPMRGTPALWWEPGGEALPDMAVALVAVTPVGSTVCPALDRYLVRVLDARHRDALVKLADDGRDYA